MITMSSLFFANHGLSCLSLNGPHPPHQAAVKRIPITFGFFFIISSRVTALPAPSMKSVPISLLRGLDMFTVQKMSTHGVECCVSFSQKVTDERTYDFVPSKYTEECCNDDIFQDFSRKKKKKDLCNFLLCEVIIFHCQIRSSRSFNSLAALGVRRDHPSSVVH